jgi:hypothetical protein
MPEYSVDRSGMKMNGKAKRWRMSFIVCCIVGFSPGGFSGLGPVWASGCRASGAALLVFATKHVYYVPFSCSMSEWLLLLTRGSWLLAP